MREKGGGWGGQFLAFAVITRERVELRWRGADLEPRDGGESMRHDHAFAHAVDVEFRTSARLDRAQPGARMGLKSPDPANTSCAGAVFRGRAVRMLTFTKPMSLAYSRKHCLQMLRLYLRMIPHWFEHTRLLMEGEGTRGQRR